MLKKSAEREDQSIATLAVVDQERIDLLLPIAVLDQVSGISIMCGHGAPSLDSDILPPTSLTTGNKSSTN